MVGLDPGVERGAWRQMGGKSGERRHLALAHREECGALARRSHKTPLYASSIDKSCNLSTIELMG